MTLDVPLTGKLRAEVKEAWLGALRSGRFQQAQGYLHVEDEDDAGKDVGGYCCLGVLCELAVQAGVVKRAPDSMCDNGVRPYVLPDVPDDVPARRAENYNRFETMPPAQVKTWAFEEPPGLGYDWYVPRSDGTDTRGALVVALTVLNDEDGLDFNAIADLIEAGL